MRANMARRGFFAAPPRGAGRNAGGNRPGGARAGGGGKFSRSSQVTRRA